MRRKLLSTGEKKRVLQHRPHCFICEERVCEADLSELEFDHIVALGTGGSNDLANYAAVHKKCHRGKGTKSLEQYKEELRLDKEFSSVLWFTDVSRKLNPSGEKTEFQLDYKTREITFKDGGKAQLHKCPNTRLWYFYYPLRREYLTSDVEVQPRALQQRRLRDLTLNLRQNFQLSPTVCRLLTSESEIRVFDGQHKATAQALGNQNEIIDCKVFIDPPLEMVRRVVVEGHGPLRQQEFRTAELYRKLTANYLELLKQWQDSHPARLVSEVELPQALGKTKKEVETDIVAYITESIIEDVDSEIADFVSKEKRPGTLPVSYDMFAWWVKLLIKQPPVDEPMESEQNLRESERQNIVQLLNYVAQNYLREKWTPENPNNNEHKKARRLFYRASFREWAKLMSESLRLIMYLRPQEPVFYRHVPPETWNRIEAMCKKLATHPIWVDPNPQVETILNSNLQKDVAQLFQTQGLNPEFLCKP